MPSATSLPNVMRWLWLPISTSPTSTNVWINPSTVSTVTHEILGILRCFQIGWLRASLLLVRGTTDTALHTFKHLDVCWSLLRLLLGLLLCHIGVTASTWSHWLLHLNAIRCVHVINRRGCIILCSQAQSTVMRWSRLHHAAMVLRRLDNTEWLVRHCIDLWLRKFVIIRLAMGPVCHIAGVVSVSCLWRLSLLQWVVCVEVSASLTRLLTVWFTRLARLECIIVSLVEWALVESARGLFKLFGLKVGAATSTVTATMAMLVVWVLLLVVVSFLLGLEWGLEDDVGTASCEKTSITELLLTSGYWCRCCLLFRGLRRLLEYSRCVLWGVTAEIRGVKVCLLLALAADCLMRRRVIRIAANARRRCINEPTMVLWRMLWSSDCLSLRSLHKLHGVVRCSNYWGSFLAGEREASICSWTISKERIWLHSCVNRGGMVVCRLGGLLPRGTLLAAWLLLVTNFSQCTSPTIPTWSLSSPRPTTLHTTSITILCQVAPFLLTRWHSLSRSVLPWLLPLARCPRLRLHQMICLALGRCLRRVDHSHLWLIQLDPLLLNRLEEALTWSWLWVSRYDFWLDEWRLGFTWGYCLGFWAWDGVSRFLLDLLEHVFSEWLLLNELVMGIEFFGWWSRRLCTLLVLLLVIEVEVFVHLLGVVVFDLVL